MIGESVPYPDVPELWPIPLQECVRRHGPTKVYRAGLTALHYPPIWAHQRQEFAAVIAAVNEGT